MNTTYHSGPASLFATAAREKVFHFKCAGEMRVGAYLLAKDDELKAVADGFGLFHLYVDWADGSLGRFNAHDINKLAGRAVVGGYEY